MAKLKPGATNWKFTQLGRFVVAFTTTRIIYVKGDGNCIYTICYSIGNIKYRFIAMIVGEYVYSLGFGIRRDT